MIARIRNKGRFVARPPIIRFLAFVKMDQLTGCWNWIGCKDKSGYGFFFASKKELAHRFSYEHFIEKISDNLTVDQLCRNKRCVNPDHLEAVTTAENTKRAAKTHCKNGHPLTGENLRICNKGKSRRCRMCSRRK